MKVLFTSSILLLHFYVIAQVDTVKTYFQDGSVHSIHPMKNDKPFGTVKYYYFGGKLKSEVSYKSNQLISKEYYENSNPKFITITENNQQILIKKFNSEGNLIKLEKKLKNGKISKTWYDNKNIKSYEKYKNGEPINCFLYMDTAISKDIKCVCGYKPIIWKNDTCFYLNGEPTNINYKSKSKNYFESGKVNSKYLIRNNELRKRTWDEYGNKITSQKLPYRGDTIIIEKSTSNGMTKAFDKIKGGPILKTKNPFRDTTIQTNFITVINLSVIQYFINIDEYDSYGLIKSSFFFYGPANLNLTPKEEKYAPYLKDYDFYISGNNSGKEFHDFAIGINKKEKNAIVLIAGGQYDYLILNKKIFSNDKTEKKND
jgi:antitoxin component YwqK of YwqJK toxin-antitoxin module